MKVWSVVAMFAAAGAGAVVGAKYEASQVAVVHAQAYASCMASVPKEWGKFRGASTFGLAFEDDKGVLRFLSHPPCGNNLSGDSNTPTANVDLQVNRR